MHGIETQASCCQWLPCFSENGLKNRACLNWRMIPGLIALVACITGVVCVLLWESPYLCLIFVPGIIASTYITYLGWDFQNLKSLAENNDQLEESVQTLKSENEELQKQLSFFGTENQKLQESAKNLSTLAEELKTENLNLLQANQDLQHTIHSLEELKKTLEEKAGKHVEQLSNLEHSLAGIQIAAQEDHTMFANHLHIFVKEVGSLTLTRANFEKTGNSIEEKMKQQVDLLLNTAKMLETIFTQINQWKNEKFVAQRIQEQQLINDQVRKLESMLAHGDGRLEEQKKHIEELIQLKEGFGKALSDLLGQVGNLKNIRGELAIQVEKVTQAAHVFKTYNLQYGN